MYKIKDIINKVHCADCLGFMKTLPDNSVDTILTDPPYGLSFMGKKWDYDVPSEAIWIEALRVLKPGGTALIFAGSRTQHRMAVRVEDSGFILKDTIMYLYGSGFPKASDIAKNISKGIDKRKELLYNESIWNTKLNNVKFAEKIYLNELIEAGLLTTLKEFVAENVIKFLKQKGLNVSVGFAEKSLKDLNLTQEEILIVPENAEAKPRQQLLNVPIVELNSEDPSVKLKVKIIFVPVDVRTCLCEKVESKIKEDAVQKIENGNKKSLKKMDINVECVELIENLKHTTLNQLKIIPNFATMLKTGKLTATNVIITKSIRECLIISTVDIVGEKTTPDGKKWSDRRPNGIPSQFKEFNKSKEESDKQCVITEPSTPEAKLWNGWKSHGLKPAYEPILVCMKPNEGTYANNALTYGVSGLNIDGGRIKTGNEDLSKIKAFGSMPENKVDGKGFSRPWMKDKDSILEKQNRAIEKMKTLGRFPANLLLSCSCDLQTLNLSDIIEDIINNIKLLCQSKNLKLLATSVDLRKCLEDTSKKLEELFAVENVDTLILEKTLGKMQEDISKMDTLCSVEMLMESMSINLNTFISGKRQTEKYQKVMKCITSILSEMITDLKISNVLLEKNIEVLRIKVINGIQELRKGKLHQADCPVKMLDEQSGELKSGSKKANQENYNHKGKEFVAGMGKSVSEYQVNKGGASRFFYCAKASKSERNIGCEELEEKIGGGMAGTQDQTLLTGSGNERNNIMKNNHPTVKPLSLMKYLCTLTKTPTGGIVLDPFGGSGTTGMACKATDRPYILIEREDDYCKIARERIKGLKIQQTLI